MKLVGASSTFLEYTESATRLNEKLVNGAPIRRSGRRRERRSHIHAKGTFVEADDYLTRAPTSGR